MARLSISLLGPFQVTLDGTPLTSFATDKVRALLAYLVVESHHPHRREALAGLLWPDQPEHKARQNVRQALTYLRQALGGEDETLLIISRETVQFNAGCDHWLDIAAFTALHNACQDHRHRRLESCLPCTQRMERAAELYRGEFLEHFFLSDSDTFEEWTSLEREWLHRQMVAALAHLAHYHEQRGDVERTRQYAWQQVTLEPWREEAHRRLMRVLAASGQRSAALAQYEACRQALAEELGVAPTAETLELYEQIRAGQEAPGLQKVLPGTRLPPSPTSFVGREQDLAEIAELLANPDCRLLTLVGPGGIGKTRLALQAAERQIGAFADGVYFAPLSSADSVESLVATVADTLKFPWQELQDPQDQLLKHLRDKEMLLVLDSMEHLLPVSPLASLPSHLDADFPFIPGGGEGKSGLDVLVEILDRAPGVILLVTSRARLNLQEEWAYETEGLAYPSDGPSAFDSTLLALDDCDAIQLFQQRARQAQRRFSLSSADIPNVVRLCQLVEGMPLGIELAASWVAVRSCEVIVRELEHNLDILATSMRNVPERQRSLRATFEHSWQLLSEPEKIVFARLSLFRGGFQPEAAAAVARASPADLLALLDKSLIRRISSTRYDIHELLRQYAAEKLAGYPQEHEQVQGDYVRYMAAFLEQRQDTLKGNQPQQALADIALELENARHAWRLAVTRGDVREVEASLESLRQFYTLRSRFREGIELLAWAVDGWKDKAPDHILGKLLAYQGPLYRRTGEYGRANAVLEPALDIFRCLKWPAEQAFCQLELATVARAQGKYQLTRRLAEESLALSRQVGDVAGEAHALYVIGLMLYATGEIDRADELFTEGLAAGHASGNPQPLLLALNALGDLACHRGDYVKAQAMFEECLNLSRELGNPFNTAIHLNNLGSVWHELGNYPQAQALYQESLDICREIGDQEGQSWALSNLGEAAYELGEYRQAQAFYHQGLAIGHSIQNRRVIATCLNNLGEVACVLGKDQEARAYLAEALKIVTGTQEITLLMKILVNLAIPLAHQGQKEQASVVLGLVLDQPATEQDTRQKASRLLAELSLAPPEAPCASLDVVIAQVLAELEQ